MISYHCNEDSLSINILYCISLITIPYRFIYEIHEEHDLLKLSFGSLHLRSDVFGRNVSIETTIFYLPTLIVTPENPEQFIRNIIICKQSSPKDATTRPTFGILYIIALILLSLFFLFPLLDQTHI
jgi:hypothetical protein